jgi:hypothetical protein
MEEQIKDENGDIRKINEALSKTSSSLLITNAWMQLFPECTYISGKFKYTLENKLKENN